MDKPLRVAPNNEVSKVAWLHIEEGRVAFVRTRGQVLAYTIGGKPRGDEQLIDALIREAKEETTADLIAHTIRYYDMLRGPCHGYIEGTELKMFCFWSDYRGTLRPSGEIEEIVWLDMSHIGQGLTTVMGDDLLGRLGREGFIRG